MRVLPATAGPAYLPSGHKKSLAHPLPGYGCIYVVLKRTHLTRIALSLAAE